MDTMDAMVFVLFFKFTSYQSYLVLLKDIYHGHFIWTVTVITPNRA